MLARKFGDRHDVFPARSYLLEGVVASHARIWGQTRCLGAGGTNRGTDTIFDVRHTGGERSTCNVQLSRFNGVTERAHGGWGMGTDTICGGRLMLPGHPDMGTGTISWGQTRCRVYAIWGQTRCPVYRAGTFNGQRSTLNFQWGDRKGACWSGYGDRHDMWWPADAARAPGYGDRHDIMGTNTMSGIRDMGTDTMPGIPIRNV